MSRVSKFAKLKPAVEALARKGMPRSEVRGKFSEIPEATFHGWWKAITEKLEEESALDTQPPDDDDSEAIAVNVEAVEMPDGNVVNLKDYQNGRLESQRRHRPKVKNGISNFYAVVDVARSIIDTTDNDYAAIAAGQLMLRCLYAEAELPRHILDGTAGAEIAQESKALEDLSLEELNQRYQEKLGNL